MREHLQTQTLQLVHVAAGTDYLNRYTSNTAHTGDEDHPAGIIAMVLKDKIQGKASNFPHKVLSLTLGMH
jgi:hypothetical protein